MKINQLLVIGFVAVFTGCSVNPPIIQVPVEDHDVIVDPEPVEPTVIISAVEDESSVQTSSEISENEVVDKPNEPIVPVSPSAIKTAPKNAAVLALLDSATQQNKAGEHRAAQTSLQRAQRIAPREPEVYYDLAMVHFELEDYGLAEQVALKGVSIVQGQPKELYRFWRLIADVRMAAGNSSGSKKAKEIASRYH